MTFTNNKVCRNLTSPPAANTAVVIGAAIDRLTFAGNFISNKAANNNIALGFALSLGPRAIAQAPAAAPAPQPPAQAPPATPAPAQPC